MATITVYREYGAPLVTRMKVFVDDTLVTELGSDSAVNIEAEPGQHTVRVVMGVQASAPVTVSLERETGAWLRAGVDLRAHSVRGLVHPDEALDLEVVRGRPRTPPARTETADLGRLDGAERLDLSRRPQQLLRRAAVVLLIAAPTAFLAYELGGVLAR